MYYYYYPSRYVLLLALADRIATVLSSPATTYDQRQSGDLNVQVHLKDIQVLALLDTELLDDYTEYDYIYDYADFTIKPINKPTTEPTLQISSGTTEGLTEISDSASENSTYVSNSTVEETTVSFDAGQTNDTLSVSSSERTMNSTTEEKISESRINEETPFLGLAKDSSSKRLSGKRCRSGYSPDGKGRCRRQSQRRLSLIPLAMKLTPRLFDDLMGLNIKTPTH